MRRDYQFIYQNQKENIFVYLIHDNNRKQSSNQTRTKNIIWSPQRPGKGAAFDISRS